MPTFNCTYSDGSKTAKIEAKSFEEAAVIFTGKFPSLAEYVNVRKGLFGDKFFPNNGREKCHKKLNDDKVEKQKAKEKCQKKLNEDKAQKQKSKEEALDHIIQKVTERDAEHLSYGEINVVVENFFAHEESIREQEADLRRRLYALTLTNSTLQGLIQTTILSRLISDNSSKGTGATASGGNSMGKALVAASLLNNQQLRGMSEDVEDISEGFGFDGE